MLQHEEELNAYLILYNSPTKIVAFIIIYILQMRD